MRKIVVPDFASLDGALAGAARLVGRWAAFVLLGVATAAVGEWQYSVFIRADVANFIGSVAFNTLYMSGAFALTAVLLRGLGRRRATAVLLALLAGLAGLAVEWFLIGNSPWGNPDALQVGMFAYWGCMVLLPLLVVYGGPGTARARRRALLFAAGYAAAAPAAQLLPWPEARVAYHLWSVVAGYMILYLLILRGLWRGWGAGGQRKS